MDPVRIAILTVSDGVVAGTREDTSGDAIVAWADRPGHTVVRRMTSGDAAERIIAALVTLADSGDIDVVLTTGGTGLTMRDVTPEATRTVIEREVPGIPELIRARGADATPYSWLSRGVAGTRGRTLIVNLPGSRGGVRDGLAMLEKLLPHAVQLLRGVDTGKHEAPH